ncbi:hypothetical protein MUU53_06325 [Rhizobium lemnae]|uniref:Uncharacterized protein n=1 Tax=Rhizobium lemnae TaxID=1214924 RepID=A0ABV8E2V4_9HYPH|nr:hypothetical protein [Rhizobium lemnae]MCJ8507528.1 hypothetical protein [Rhizobium lemnae]
MGVPARKNGPTHQSPKNSSNGEGQIAGSVSDFDDYNGMPLSEWKSALHKDVEERFGPAPDDLRPVGDAGW